MTFSMGFRSFEAFCRAGICALSLISTAAPATAAETTAPAALAERCEAKIERRTEPGERPELRTEAEFFSALRRELLFAFGENLVRRLGFLETKTHMGLLHPLLKLEGRAFTTRLAHMLCGVGCAGADRTALAAHLESYFEALRREGTTAVGLADVVEELETERQGLISILKTRHLGEEDRLNAYHAHLSANSILGYSQLFFTSELATPVRREGVCHRSSACAWEWQNLRLTETSVRHALITHFGHLQAQASALNHMEFSDENLTQFYRFSPDVVVRVYARYAGAMNFHCKYLAKSLAAIGDQMALSETGNGVAYLAPMTAFWLLGTGVGGLQGANIGLAKSLTAVAAITAIDLLWRTHQVRRQENAARKVLLWNLDEGAFPESRLNQYLLIRESVARDRAAIQGIVMYEGVSLLVGGMVGKGLAFGAKNIFHRFADVPGLFRKLSVSRKTYPTLFKLKIHNERDLAQWIRSAPPHEVNRLLKALERDSLGVAYLGLKELADAFYIYPFHVRPATGTHEERVRY